MSLRGTVNVGFCCFVLACCAGVTAFVGSCGAVETLPAVFCGGGVCVVCGVELLVHESTWENVNVVLLSVHESVRMCDDVSSKLASAFICYITFLALQKSLMLFYLVASLPVPYPPRAPKRLDPVERSVARYGVRVSIHMKSSWAM